MDNWEDITFATIDLTGDSMVRYYEPTISGPPSSKRVGASSFEVLGNPYLIVGPNDLMAPYTSIQGALNALQESRHSGIKMLDGDYQLTEPVYFPDRNVDLVGESQNVKIKNAPGQVALDLIDLTKKFSFSNFVLESQNTTVLSKIVHIHATTTFAGDNQCNVDMSNILFSLSETIGDIGLYCFDGFGIISISDCIINNGATGLNISNRNVNIRRNVIDLVSGTGISLLNPSENGNVVVANNEITNVLGTGMNIFANGATISNNLIEFAASGAFYSQPFGINNGGSDCTIKGNKIKCDTVGYNESFIAIALNEIKNNNKVQDNAINLLFTSGNSSAAIYSRNGSCNISNNNITIKNRNTVFGSYGIYQDSHGVGPNEGDGNIISNNNIEANNVSYDVGMYMTSGCSDNQGSDNITKNVGTSVSDSGANNTVTAKDI